MPVQGRGARAKGSAAEREVRDLLRANGFPRAERTALSGAGYLKGDIDRAEPFSFEVKRQERPAWAAWMKQVEEQAEVHEVPIVVWRKSRSPWWALVRFDALLTYLSGLKGRADFLVELAGRDGIDPDLRREILEVLRGDAGQ